MMQDVQLWESKYGETKSSLLSSCDDPKISNTYSDHNSCQQELDEVWFTPVCRSLEYYSGVLLVLLLLLLLLHLLIAKVVKLTAGVTSLPPSQLINLVRVSCWWWAGHYCSCSCSWSCSYPCFSSGSCSWIFKDLIQMCLTIWDIWLLRCNNCAVFVLTLYIGNTLWAAWLLQPLCMNCHSTIKVSSWMFQLISVRLTHACC